MTAATRTITIIVRNSNDFDVHEGERYSGRLCWEEMLGQIATMTHPLISAPRFRMDTPEEQAARWRKPAESAPQQPGAALQVVIREFGLRAGPSDALLPIEQQSPLVREAMQAATTYPTTKSEKP